MNKTWGLMLALVFGAVIGWVAQQFQVVSTKHQAHQGDDSLMSRNEVRLTKLKQLRTDSAVVALNRAATEGQSVEIRRDALDQLLDYISSGRVELALQQYREHLSEYAQDLSLSRAIAEKWFNSGDYEATLILLYEQRMFISFEHEDALLQLIFATVDKIELALTEQSNLASLVSLYRLLISLHGDYTPYYLRLTHWLIESGEFYAAEESLLGAVNDFTYQRQVEVLKARIEGSDVLKEAGEVSVPLSKVGEHYVAEVLLNDVYPVKLMIDTGASVSVLKSDLINEAMPEMIADARPLQMNTANGSVTGRKILIQSFQLGSIQLTHVDMGVVPLPNFKFDGLLGMNVLSRFEFFIDQEQQLLLLR